jgi:hypothetical protein
MSLRSHSCLVESLESRQLMAVTLDVGANGVLHGISTADGAQTDDLTLSVLPGNRLNVKEGAADLGTFSVGQGLDISLGDTADGFVNHLDLNNNTLATNLRVRMGDTGGLDQFRVTTPDNGTGTLAGNFEFSAGEGSQFLLFGDFGQPTSRTINITGNVEVDMGGGGDQNFGPPDAVSTAGGGPNNSVLNVGGNMNVANSTVLALSGSIGGNLSSDSSGKSADQLVILGNYSNPFSVGKNVSIVTGDGADEVDVQAVDIGGNLAIRTNGGDDRILLVKDVDLSNTIPSRVGKNVSVDGGAGNDTVQIDGLLAGKHTDLLNVESVV